MGARRLHSEARQRQCVQRGQGAVEFALVAPVLFTLVFGAAEFGRMLWTWNAAAEATRLGARLAVVCDKDAGFIKTRMIEQLPALKASNITLVYEPAGCTVANCESVTVGLTGYTFTALIPFASVKPLLPAFTTTLSREYMTSASNDICS